MKKILLTFCILHFAFCIFGQRPFQQKKEIPENLKNMVTTIQQNPTRSGEYSEVAFPFDTTFLFDYPNVTTHDIAGGGGVPIVIFKFTLDHNAVVNFKDDGCFLDYAPFKNAIDMNNYMGDGQCYTTSLPAGTYYVICADFIGKLQNEGAFNVHISFSEIIPTELTFPIDQDITLTYANTDDVLYGGNRGAMFAVTLPNFGIYNELSTETVITSYNFGAEAGTNITAILPDGRIFFNLVDYSGSISETQDLTTHLTFTLNTTITPTAIQVPYAGNIEITTTNSVNLWDYYVKFYTFTLENDAWLHFYSENALNDMLPYFQVSSIDMSQDYADGNDISVLLSAGTYLLFVDDDGHIVNDGVTSVSATMKIDVEHHYNNLDYSKEITTTPIYSSLNNLVEFVEPMIPVPLLYGEGFHFNVEAGKIYKLHCESFANGISQEATSMVGVNLLRDYLTGDMDYDAINGNGGTMSSHNQFVVDYYGYENTTVKALFVAYGDTMPNELLFSFYLEIEDAPVAETETPNTEAGWHWETMTLPFFKNLVFDTINYNGWTDEYGKTYKPFVLTVAEDITLAYVDGTNHLGWSAPFDIYLDAEMTSLYLDNLWSYTQVNLPAGTYYLVFNDDGFPQHNGGGIYNVDVRLEAITFSNSITLEELLTDPNITTVDYANFPYFEEFTTADANIVYFDDYKYAKAYKITGMAAGDSGYIHIANSYDAYLYIYQMDGGNGITQLSDGGVDDAWSYETGNQGYYGGDLDSYWSGEVPETRDYYIVATYYDSYENAVNSQFMVNFWKTSTATAPVLGEITNTTASAASVLVDDSEGLNANDIKIALMSLTITANANLTAGGTTSFAVGNNPFAWTIAPDNTSAIYINLEAPMGYNIAANYVPATVAISLLSANQNDIHLPKLSLYPNPCTDYFVISGDMNNMSDKFLVRIYDISGKLHMSQLLHVLPLSQQINVADLPRGSYIVTVQNGNTMNVLKFVKK
jgi:hypothetical protein